MGRHHDQHDMLALGDLDDNLSRRAKPYLEAGSDAGRTQLCRLEREIALGLLPQRLPRVQRALLCIGQAFWGAVRCLCTMIGWMSQCIAVLHELTDQRIWPAMLMIALPIAGYLMFSLVHSMTVMPAMDVAPIASPPPTSVPAPRAGFRWARVVGTEGVGLLIRNVPNGKRCLGDGPQEGTTVMVIGGPATTANAQNPIWWQVRHNDVTGWVGRVRERVGWQVGPKTDLPSHALPA